MAETSRWDKLIDTVMPAPGGISDRFAYFLLCLDVLLLIGSTAASHNRLIALAVVLAGSSAGAGLGLLFAIPRRVAVLRATSEGASDGPAFRANTSLEDISDWLTKTIIGVGLVQWDAVLKRLDGAGGTIGKAMFPQQPNAALPAGVALILASVLLGGMAAYVWFYRNLPGIFRDADGEAVKKERNRAQGLDQQTSAVAAAYPLLPAPVTTGAVPLQPPGGVETKSAETEESGQSASARGGDTRLMTFHDRVRAKYIALRTRPLHLDDWCKGMFGGQPTASNGFGRRELSATIRRGQNRTQFITIEVTANPVPDTPAAIFLHNTFPQHTPQISLDAAGRATLELSAWGAFTVGALLDDGTTELELDLMAVPGGTPEFYAS